MLAYQLLENHAGIVLIGDYSSLRWLHDIIHDINERSPLIINKDGPFISFAYDVRKAYEQMREIIPPPDGFDEIGTRYGVKILWPVLLLQQRIMRVSLAYFDHLRKHQAITYTLETVIEEALRKDFGQQGEAAIEHWQHLDPTYSDVIDKLDSRGAIFCSWTKSERKRLFLSLISSFDTNYDHYYPLHIKNGQTNLISPDDFIRWSNVEWPDPDC